MSSEPPRGLVPVLLGKGCDLRKRQQRMMTPDAKGRHSWDPAYGTPQRVR